MPTLNATRLDGANMPGTSSRIGSAVSHNRRHQLYGPVVLAKDVHDLLGGMIRQFYRPPKEGSALVLLRSRAIGVQRS